MKFLKCYQKTMSNTYRGATASREHREDKDDMYINIESGTVIRVYGNKESDDIELSHLSKLGETGSNLCFVFKDTLSKEYTLDEILKEKKAKKVAKKVVKKKTKAKDK